MKLMLGEIVASQLTANPEFYFRLDKEKKVIQNNLLWNAGMYFDVEEKAIKQIPPLNKCRMEIDEDYNLIPSVNDNED